MSDKEIIASQSLVIAEQQARIIALELLLSKVSVTKTSNNSHKLPSSDLSYKNQSLRTKRVKILLVDKEDTKDIH